MVIYVTDKDEKERIASLILDDLPDWFGIPQSKKDYISNCGNMPFWAFLDDSHHPKGFIALKETSSSTVEIYVMGVLKKCHRKGVGTALWQYFLNYAKESGYEFVQVKTVQSGRYQEYDLTNNFYRKLGFKELEVFPSLWDEYNPCQIYILHIG